MQKWRESPLVKWHYKYPITCKILIWFRESSYHELIICRNWKTRDKRKMLVKVTFVQVRVLLLLGSENYSGMT